MTTSLLSTWRLVTSTSKPHFPKKSEDSAFPYFLDWLKYNVVLVEITAYSDDNAYTIFESMNDRGLNLTSTEMLKGYVLSRFTDAKDREKNKPLLAGSLFSCCMQKAKTKT